MYTLSEISSHVDPTGERGAHPVLKGFRDRGIIPSTDQSRGRGSGMVFSPLDACAMVILLALFELQVGDKRFLQRMWEELRKEDQDGNAPITQIMDWLDDRKRHPVDGGLPALLIRVVIDPRTKKVGKLIDFLRVGEDESGRDTREPRPAPVGTRVAMSLSLDLHTVLSDFTREQ
jgi:hypothetical protein